MRTHITAALRRLRSWISVAGKSRFLSYGRDLHVGKGCRLWAPDRLRIGNGVYIGKNVTIEANCDIGDYCLVANNVAVVGRHDHDFSIVGIPVRFAPWIGSASASLAHRAEKAVIEADVWLGYGAIILTGVRIGRGSIIAAGSIVTTDLPAYSIAAGNPAKVIRQRFNEPAVIDAHESSITQGHFRSSERGFEHFLIAPGR